MLRAALPLLLLLLTACSPVTTAKEKEEIPRQISVYVAPSAEERLPQIYTCAEKTQIGLVRRDPNPVSAQVSLRVGSQHNGIAYKIGELSVSVVGNAKNPAKNLSRDDILALYAGKITNWAELGGNDTPVHLWVYASEDDLQTAFTETVLGKNPLSSLARQAQNPRGMREEIAADTAALGLLPVSLTDARLRPLYSPESFPLLVFLQKNAQDTLIPLLTCLQEE